MKGFEGECLVRPRCLSASYGVGRNVGGNGSYVYGGCILWR